MARRHSAPAVGGFMRVATAAVLLLCTEGQKDIQKDMELYAPKSCKYSLMPASLSSRAYTAYTGEVHVHDVFGLPSTVKRHIVQLDVPMQSLLTLTAEVHRDTPTTLSVDAFKRGEVGKPSGRILFGKNLLGSGGADTKAFLHGALNEMYKEVDLVFELTSVEVAASQVDARVAEARCWPVRLDLTAIPFARAALHWPTSCPDKNRLPPPLQDKAGSSQVVVLSDTNTLGLELEKGKHYAYRFGDERPWSDYGRSLWNGVLEVPPRLHRFVRFFIRASFRFPSSPMQLVIELFETKDMPDGSALAPACEMGCLGGVPVYNGQIVDHAMPTGFRYRLWLLAASLPEWTAAVPQRGRHCFEFDLDYKIKFEERLTPFEVGPQAWLCEFSRLPERIVQLPHPTATEKLNSVNQLVAGRTVWIRDRFGFPPDEVADMEHKITIEISEPCVFRATTHHSDGVDVFIALRDKDGIKRACATAKHPGPVPRQSIFCVLQPGTYTLIFFADYPLGGLHPCSDFFAQVALRPVAMSSDAQTKQCVDDASDLAKLSVVQSLALTTEPRWKTIKVPITFSETPSNVVVWSQEMVVEEADVAQQLYLRMVLNSDYVSSDLRFQVRYEGKYVADTQVTAHGYADMIGPLDPGAYRLQMYYVSGTGGAKDQKLCSTSMVDLRVVSRSQYENNNRTSQWLCTSTRVPPPDMLAPQAEEQILMDSEYVIPESGRHDIVIKLSEQYLIRALSTSADADFRLELRSGGNVYQGQGSGALEALVAAGTHKLRLVASVKGLGTAKACSTFMFNLLLQPRSSAPVCPWSPSSTDESAASEAQRKAEDHLGGVTLDLVPKKVSKDIQVKAPVSFWMSADMYMKFDLETTATSAIRIDVAVQPPFLPLEVTVQKKRAAGKIEAPIASAEWTESRLLLMHSDLPKGQYVVEFRSPRKFVVVGSEGSADEINNLCAHLTVSAEVGIASTEAVNSMRSELLDLPDLLAVQPLPPSLNSVGWFASSLLPVVGTQVYNFGEATGAVRKTALQVDDKAVLRVVCEPADLSNSEISAALLLNGNSIAASDALGQLVAEVQPGSYEVELQPKANAPFLVTLGLATAARLREDLALQDSGGQCLDKFPALATGMSFAASGWSIGPTLVRLKPTWLSTEGLLAKMPVLLLASSVLYIEVGSALPLDLVRIALQVPEGLWVGEQRGLRNSLGIELPPGKYTVQVAQPKPSQLNVDPKRCLDFSIYIRAMPVNPDAKADAQEAARAVAAVGGSAPADAEGQKQELAPRDEAAVEAAPCFSMGTVPLPLDLSDAQGGSRVMGGPMNQDGRLIVRTHAMITDMHDGRKKIYLATGSKRLQLKVGVIMAGYARLSLASQLSFSVQAVGGGAPMDPTETWSSVEGWERVYIIDGTVSGVWLSFHHSHRERSESACLHFGLALEIHPAEDTAKMLECNGETSTPDEMFPSSLDFDQSSSESKVFRFAKPATNLKQIQDGFLRKVRFTLRTTSWVGAEVGYNFFTSHAEMDIVRAEASVGNTALAAAEMDFLHAPNSPLNVRLHVGQILNPGEYMLRVADDHYSNQLGGSSSACFPFSFEFRVVPKRATPTVVSVQPHPSVPIPRGVDLVLTLRFSEPPAGSLEQVVGAISLGGVHAASGGSLSSMEDRFASNKKTATVQASVGEGHLLWVIGWSAQVLADLGATAKLRIGPLKSNASGEVFHFNPPTYSLVDQPSGVPWFGGATPKDGVIAAPGAAPGAVQPQSSSGASGEVRSEGSSAGSSAASSVGDVGGIKPEGGTSASSGSGSSGDSSAEQGQPHREGSSDSGSASSASAATEDTGEIRAESRSSSIAEIAVPAPGPRPSPPPAPRPERDDEEEGNVAPRVEEWNPMDSSDEDPAEGGKRRRRSKGSQSESSNEDACPEGQVRNPATGDCGPSSAWPIGYRTVLSVCGLAVSLFMLALCWPRLRTMGSSAKGTPAARFRDIGARTSEEELGLVQAADRFDDDDDML